MVVKRMFLSVIRTSTRYPIISTPILIWMNWELWRFDQAYITPKLDEAKQRAEKIRGGSGPKRLEEQTNETKRRNLEEMSEIARRKNLEVQKNLEEQTNPEVQKNSEVPKKRILREYLRSDELMKELEAMSEEARKKHMVELVEESRKELEAMSPEARKKYMEELVEESRKEIEELNRREWEQLNEATRRKREQFAEEERRKKLEEKREATSRTNATASHSSSSEPLPWFTSLNGVPIPNINRIFRND